MRPTLLRRQGAKAREALQARLVDRVDCTPVLVAASRGYAFTGDATFAGLLATRTWPTTFGGPNGIRTPCLRSATRFLTVSGSTPPQ
jgi:hypothetical protein